MRIGTRDKTSTGALFGLALLALSAGRLPADDPPAAVLDLSTWRLMLPVDTDHPGNPDQIDQPELATFSHGTYFRVADGGGGVTFRAPCGGATSKGSAYPRSELREMADDRRTRADWSTDDDTIHVLTLTAAFTALPPAKPHCVCAQIHDKDSDLIMIRLEGKKLFIERDGADDVMLDPVYRLGTKFDLKIEAGGGRIQVWHDGVLKLTWEQSRAGCYFKAGCYTQSNTKRGDAADAYGEVLVTKLAVTTRPAEK